MAILDIYLLDAGDKARFWHNVDKRTPIECWPWIGRLSAWGYGTMSVVGWGGPATHISLILDGRPREDISKVACHRCDNILCVNPHHLFWGTQADNMRDASRKGRMRGMGKPTARQRELAQMSEEEIVELAARTRVYVGYLKNKQRTIRKRLGMD